MTIVTPNFNATPDLQRQVADPITELLRTHARTLIQSALEVEVECVLAELRESGAHVVRNGHLPERLVTTAVGDVAVSVPRIRSRDAGNVNFASTMVPRYLRRSASIDAWACYAYLRGISEADIGGVLDVVLGEGAKKVTRRCCWDSRRPGPASSTSGSPVICRAPPLPTSTPTATTRTCAGTTTRSASWC